MYGDDASVPAPRLAYWRAVRNRIVNLRSDRRGIFRAAMAALKRKERPNRRGLGRPFLHSPDYSAASRTSGAAARTSASTVCSYLVKFFWNMPTSLRAVSSNAFCPPRFDRD